MGSSIGLLIIAALLCLVVIRGWLKKAKGIGRLQTRLFVQPETDYRHWDQVLACPGKIQLETLHAGDVTGTVHGIVNLKDKPDLNIPDEKLKAPLLSHRVTHDQYGTFLIDTGFDREFSKTSWGRFEGWLKRFGTFSVQEGDGIEEQLSRGNFHLKGVFCTHFHEHQGGAPALPDDIPFVFGKGEKEIGFYPFMYSRFLQNKTNLQTIDFDQATEMPMVGKSVDLFGDGSFWAIHTPGHTPGHISYLINGEEGQYLIMGDICMCQKGFDLGVESGGQYAADLKANRRSFLKIAEFLRAYPSIHPVFGHESDEFRIEYRGNLSGKLTNRPASSAQD